MSNKKLIIYFKVPSVSKFRGNAWYLLYWKYVFKTEWSSLKIKPKPLSLSLWQPDDHTTIDHPSFAHNKSHFYLNQLVCAALCTHLHSRLANFDDARDREIRENDANLCNATSLSPFHCPFRPILYGVCVCVHRRSSKKQKKRWTTQKCMLYVTHFGGAHFVPSSLFIIDPIFMARTFILYKNRSLFHSWTNPRDYHQQPASSPGTGFERRGREFESCPSPWYYHHVLFSFSFFYVLLLLLQVGIECVYVYVCAWNLCSCVEHASHALFEFFSRDYRDTFAFFTFFSFCYSHAPGDSMVANTHTLNLKCRSEAYLWWWRYQCFESRFSSECTTITLPYTLW